LLGSATRPAGIRHRTKRHRSGAFSDG
jgi:hypothetical protein